MTDFTGTKRHNLPSAATLAQMVRDGGSLAEVGAPYGATARSVQSALNTAGYTRHGEVQTAAKAEPRPSLLSNPLPKKGEWALRQVCRPQDGDLFFPDGPGKAQQEAEAKSICARCDVRTDCLAWALLADEHTKREDRGILGGLTGDERGKLKRRMKKASA